MRPMKILALVALAVSLTGCQAGGLFSQEPKPAAAQSANDTAAQQTAQARQPAQKPAQPAAPTSTAPPDKVLASREGSFDHAKFTIDIVQLLRRERFVTLTFTATVLETSDPLGWQVNNAFAATPSGNPTIDGVYLVDVKNAKKHLAAVDSEGKCVCSRIHALFLNKDESAVFSATFAAPPPDVTTVDVHIPNVGTLSDVPIS
ncbi:hypothetical protein [Nonomuraea sp. NPDC049309]|uniref:hypothetical protein n=1 Tax=Nonomuraea sp. NPDC049309 TaxID=3364350 RepID=UPI0037159434